MLLRSMTPNVLAMDEITGDSDSEIVLEAARCGAGLLVTVHGEDEKVLYKPAFKKIMDLAVFQYAIVVDVSEGERRYRVVNLYDESMRCN